MFAALSTQAQNNKYELRGVWVASLLNIDWPSQPGLSTAHQKQEALKLLDLHQSQGLNAVFLQVRPAADALYESSFEPWSIWLSGKQGFKPKPYYDPLAFWIEECHRRGMELHAWFNPFRASLSDDLTTLARSHVVKQNPQWFVNYGNRLYFDPGIPEVRKYAIKIIAEVARKYPVDGIHFDDYFYPYKSDGQEFNDQLTYEKYGAGWSRADWRRDNINSFIKACGDTLKAIDPQLRFGISPFGVWRNKDRDPMGSDTRAGQSNYDDLYADVLTWLREGWVDYLAPQLYWHVGYELADYRILLDWWSRHSYNRHIYIGQSAYKVRPDADFSSWRSAAELSRHLELNRNYPQIKGNVYFSSSALSKNKLGVGDTIAFKNRHQAIVPYMDYKPEASVQAPQLYRISHGHNKLTLYWSAPKDDSRYHLIYRFKGRRAAGVEDPSNIIGKVPAGTSSFRDVPPEKGYYTYLITSVSRSNHESPASYSLTIKYRKRKPKSRPAKT